MFRLDVFYDLKQDEDGNLLFRDDEMQEIAGVKSVGSGCAMECMTRDVQLEFETEAMLEGAKTELREAGFRFAAMCPVHPTE